MTIKLMCISNKSPFITRLSVTVGKVYEGEIDEYNNYILINDAGEINSYSKKTFIPLAEWRLEKLKEIGI